MTVISSLNDIEPVRQYLNRIGARPRSFRQAVVEDRRGKYWTDLAIINFGPSGTIEVESDDPKYKPTDDEIGLIKAAFKTITLPKATAVASINRLPEEVRNKTLGEELFVFYDDNGSIVMVHERCEGIDPASGEHGKYYVPWTPFDDGVWRRQEPDGKLPLYGQQWLKNDTTIIGLHEGPKSAEKLMRLKEEGKLKDIPWGEDLDRMVHMGWIGGALNPHRTNFNPINKKGAIEKVYIFPDNDKEGLASVQRLAYRIKKRCYSVELSEQWPQGWDFADPWPKNMIKWIDENGKHIDPEAEGFDPASVIRVDVGPTFRSCLHPATWATDTIPQFGANGQPVKPTIVLRDHFKTEWVYAEQAELYVNKELPSHTKLSPKAFNKKMTSFSHTGALSNLLDAFYAGTTINIAYEPPQAGRRMIVLNNETSAINLFERSEVKPIAPPGDLTEAIKPWLEFTEYMFPDLRERHEVLRWEATLVSRLDIKMSYALLMISETQGVGKTLRATALSRLVGIHNSSFPSEREVVDPQFNGWLGNKRLVICNEIYAGQSWKAYNVLKSAITDDDVTVNEKYEKAYKINNHANMIANSNSKKALKMDQSDRRWLYPKINEKVWEPRSNYSELAAWLAGGGLQLLRYWADNFEEWCKTFYDEEFRKANNMNYVSKNEAAPMTETKKEMIGASLSEALIEIGDLLDAVDPELDVCLPVKTLRAWLSGRINEKVYERDFEIVKHARSKGWGHLGKRMKFNGVMQQVIVSPHMWKDEWEDGENVHSEVLARIRDALKRPGELTDDIL